MLDKIILGTANFTQQYGILSSGLLCEEEVKKILDIALRNGITTIDTAFGYGDIFSNFLSNTLKKFIINTKLSVKDDLLSVREKLKELSSLYKIDVLMVHDPQNIKNLERQKLQDFFKYLKEEGFVHRIGVSVYEVDEVERFSSMVFRPDVIQLPLNPLNQSFNDHRFKQYMLENNNEIEIHARSLFLQGVLLSDHIPEKMHPLKKDLANLRQALSSYPSILSGLLAWANRQDWVHKWVLGVSSISNLDEIFKCAAEKMQIGSIKFISSNHILLDPREW